MDSLKTGEVLLASVSPFIIMLVSVIIIQSSMKVEMLKSHVSWTLLLLLASLAIIAVCGILNVIYPDVANDKKLIWFFAAHNLAELLEKYALMIDILRFELNLSAFYFKDELDEKRTTGKYYSFLAINMLLSFFLIFCDELIFELYIGEYWVK